MPALHGMVRQRMPMLQGNEKLIARRTSTLTQSVDRGLPTRSRPIVDPSAGTSGTRRPTEEMEVVHRFTRCTVMWARRTAAARRVRLDRAMSGQSTLALGGEIGDSSSK